MSSAIALVAAELVSKRGHNTVIAPPFAVALIVLKYPTRMPPQSLLKQPGASTAML